MSAHAQASWAGALCQ